MLANARRSWERLKASPPGRRFQQRYERRHEGQGGGARKALTLGAGILVSLAGIFFLAVPGPGLIVIALGAALIGEESRRAARLLDAGELRLRRLLAWSHERWKRAPTPARAALVLLAAALAALGAWAAWRILFG